ALALTKDDVAWVKPGPHVFEATQGGVSSSASADVAADGRVADLTLRVASSRLRSSSHTDASSLSSARSSSTPSSPSSSSPLSSSSSSNADPSNADDAGATSTTSIVPIAAVVAGATLGAGGGIVWGACNNHLADGMSKSDRDTVQTIGVVGFAVT